MRQLISSGSTFEQAWGYSRALVVGDEVFVSGTTGFDYEKMQIVEGARAQALQAFANIERALAEAGASLRDVVRVHYYLPDRSDWDAIGAVAGEKFGQVRPAATALVCELVDPRMKVEIEVSARRSPEPARGGLGAIRFRPPTLIGDRVLLRGWEPSDVDGVFAYASDPEVAAYMAWERHASRADSLGFLNEITADNYRHRDLSYALCLKSAPERALGGVGAFLRSRQHGTYELGYVLARAEWGKGLVPEAARLLIDHVFTHTDAQRVYAPIFAENEKSRRAALKMGLTFEGVLRQSLCFRGRRWDEAVYAALRSEWPVPAR